MSQLMEPPSVPRQEAAGGSAGAGPGSGRGSGTGDLGRFMSQALSRLSDENIAADPEFVQALQSFLAQGLATAERQDPQLERFESAWEQVINTIIAFAAENQLRRLDARAFFVIYSRLCPGFWPFC